MGTGPIDKMRLAVDIRIDDLKGPEIALLLEEHLRSLRALSPPESVHALDLAKLHQPEVMFWTVWEGSDLLGCVEDPNSVFMTLRIGAVP